MQKPLNGFSEKRKCLRASALRTRHRREASARRAPANQAGFTLLEVLIALMFLSVGVLAMAQVFTVAQRHAGHAREETIAVSLVDEIREKILSESFDDVYSIFNGVDTDDPGSIPTPAADWATHLHDELSASGRGTVTVLTGDQDETLGDGLIDVTVTVSWQEGSRAVSIPVRFLVAKMGGSI